jgi:UDP-N-acetylglucosamine acyltransferase
MTGAHVGHDAQLGNRIVLANQVAIAGHCVIGDDVVIGGLSGIHQFVRIGHGAMIGALTMVTNDVIPYGLVQGPRGTLDGLNLVGLKRRGLDRTEISALRAAYTALAGGSGSFVERARALVENAPSAQVREVVEFILSQSDRSFLGPK